MASPNTPELFLPEDHTPSSNTTSFSMHEEADEIPTATARRNDAFARLNNGGVASLSSYGQIADTTEEIQLLFEHSLGPGSERSLSGIATRAFVLGNVFTLSVISASWIKLATVHPAWRLPFMFAALSLFHFLEFWTTARYNTRSAEVSSFLLSSNGKAYLLAHVSAIVECALVVLFFPSRAWVPGWVGEAIVALGLVLVVMGQGIRSTAMVHAATNFNHVVQWRKDTKHRLVTDGVYTYLRHPSYFGYFWWALGTQFVLGNIFCSIVYAIVLWRFFAARIKEEERLLTRFFGDEYTNYRKRTIVGIPFIR